MLLRLVLQLLQWLHSAGLMLLLPVLERLHALLHALLHAWKEMHGRHWHARKGRGKGEAAHAWRKRHRRLLLQRADWAAGTAATATSNDSSVAGPTGA